MTFQPPDHAEIMRALGDVSGLPLPMQRALLPGDHFDPVPAPHPGDWLSVQQEHGQTFDEYAGSHPRKPDGLKRVIYLAPLGPFSQDTSPSLSLLRDCAEAYFCLEARIMPAVSGDSARFTARTNPVTGNRQILTGDVLAYLRRRFPPDAFCVLGITMEDLYPDEDWNFVFGQASLNAGIGVFSFARYDPAFYGNSRENGYLDILNARSCTVLVHETAHMFSLAHCIYFHCLMNGSNHLAESDARPMHLCPVCLRKLHHAIGFDLVQRYQAIFYFSRQAGFDREARWVRRRLEHILGS
ncbi:MAG TPA: archaemetzincin [Deltaproteobacteria bacterium]|jgi:archaemetzincin|nr:archaemetzincin [Deltaproteobacteria bacterium]HOI07394.1 archaemetzincin [Deltaproteobacteria bacterium]